LTKAEILITMTFAEPMINRSLVPAPVGAFIGLPGVFYFWQQQNRWIPFGT
jgi:hypothetical protein